MRYKIFWFAVLLCVTAEFSSAMAQTPPDPDASPTFMERLNRWGSKIFGTRSSNDPTPKPAMPSPDSNYVVLPPNALPPENIVPGVPPAPTNMPVMADPNGQIPVPPAPSLDERLPPKYVSPDPSTAQNPTQDGSVDNPAVEPMQSRLSRFRQSILEKNDPPPSNSTPVNAPAGNAVPADPTIITPYGPGSVNSPPILSEPKAPGLTLESPTLASPNSDPSLPTKASEAGPAAGPKEASGPDSAGPNPAGPARPQSALGAPIVSGAAISGPAMAGPSGADSRSAGDPAASSGRSPVLLVDTMGPQKVLVGEPATFEIIVQNSGQVAAEQVTLTVQTPSFAEVAGAEPSAGVANLEKAPTRPPSSAGNSPDWKPKGASGSRCGLLRGEPSIRPDREMGV